MTEQIEIRPLTEPAHADGLRVPGSKSITNRALLLAALAGGTSELRHALFSDDTKYMAAALRQLDLSVSEDQAAASFVLRGQLGPIVPMRCLQGGNAGTAVRFLVALGCVIPGSVVVDGNERMRQRPIADLVDALRQLGAHIECPTGCPPVTVRKGIEGGHAAVNGERSSQYLSALLMVAPYAERGVELEVTGELIAKPYVDMTIAVMRQFGVEVERDGYRQFQVKPGRYRAPAVYEIEPDASSAHYFLAAAALTRGRVRIDGIGSESLQGDAHFADVLERMGARVTWSADSIAVEGPEQLDGIDVDMGDISDTAMTTAVLAPFARGPVRVRNVAHLRIQESDRIAAVVDELRKLGGDVKAEADGWTIAPSTLHGGAVETYDDHRIAMAFSLIGLRVKGVVIRNPACVTKTFPNYFEFLEKLRPA